MVTLASGLRKFQNQVYPKMREDFQKLASGQSPETLFITCSDSRIDPSLVTQTRPGELFVIRNAGNIVPPPGTGELSVEATIQYAVDVLKVRHIVVCGHSHCGAIQGLLNLSTLDEMPAIKHWVLKSEKILQRIDDRKDRICQAIGANVTLQLDHLQQYPCVAEAMSNGRLSLHGWVYHFESGKIDFIKASPNLSVS
jgi:carbonic anhydrase